MAHTLNLSLSNNKPAFKNSQMEFHGADILLFKILKSHKSCNFYPIVTKLGIHIK